MTDTLTNLWVDRSRPVLRWVADNEDGAKGIVSIDTIAGATGLTDRQVEVELERLNSDGLINAKIERMMNGGDIGSWFMVDPRLTGEGARRLDMWPQAETLLVVIERMAGAATDPVEKSRLEKLVTSVKEVGLPVLTEVLASAAKAHL